MKPSGKSRKVAYYATELAEGGELFGLIKQTKGMPEPMARYFFK
jgi:hypothetical protein